MYLWQCHIIMHVRLYEVLQTPLIIQICGPITLTISRNRSQKEAIDGKVAWLLSQSATSFQVVRSRSPQNCVTAGAKQTFMTTIIARALVLSADFVC
jgi:hypothetical protein